MDVFLVRAGPSSNREIGDVMRGVEGVEGVGSMEGNQRGLAAGVGPGRGSGGGRGRRVPQRDGPGDGDEDDGEEEEDGEEEAPAGGSGGGGGGDGAKEAAGDEILSEDSGDEEEEEGDISNFLCCQFEKVNRVKNKWKINMRDGVFRINGQDYLFKKGTGEWTWS